MFDPGPSAVTQSVTHNKDFTSLLNILHMNRILCMWSVSCSGNAVEDNYPIGEGSPRGHETDLMNGSCFNGRLCKGTRDNIVSLLKVSGWRRLAKIQHWTTFCFALLRPPISFTHALISLALVGKVHIMQTFFRGAPRQNAKSCCLFHSILSESEDFFSLCFIDMAFTWKCWPSWWNCLNENINSVSVVENMLF